MHRKKSSSLNPPPVDGKHNMTCLELCDSDDLATMMTVDAVLGFTTHKMDKNYNSSSIDKKVREKWKDTMAEFINDLNYENAYAHLIASDKIKSSLKKDERFKRHIFRFLYLFDKRSGIELRPCFRYENEGRKGAAILATKEWEKGSQISTLFGCIAEMSHEEEEIFHESKNEFSVMYSTRKNCSQLWLGPAAYVNHDCKPNCRFTEGNDDSKMTLETLRDLHPGDELLIYYGNNFFGVENAECECFTCELRDQGLFSRNFHNTVLSYTPFSLTMANGGHINNEINDTKRHIVTRSAKMVFSDRGYTDCRERSRLSSLPQSYGGLDKLKKSEDTYSLRVTYSRIDRYKKSIQPMNNFLKSSKTPLKPKLKSKTLLNHQQSKNKQSSTTRRSNRQLDSQSHTKLTIKLRKNANHPNQYEQITVKPSSDSNIFCRLKQFYRISQPDSQPDTPPFLSPWFVTTDKHPQQSPTINMCPSSSSSLKRSKKTKVKLKNHSKSTSLVSSNLLKIVNCCENSSDDCPHRPETSSSDLPSSPTIPILEIESETELAPPQLICELLEPQVPNSPNKGIVMKFSRIGGNKFTSLLS